MENITKEEFVFTAPLTISAKDRQIIHNMLSDFTKKVSKIVAKSPPEKLCCLNIDWIDIA